MCKKGRGLNTFRMHCIYVVFEGSLLPLSVNNSDNPFVPTVGMHEKLFQAELDAIRDLKQLCRSSLGRLLTSQSIPLNTDKLKHHSGFYCLTIMHPLLVWLWKAVAAELDASWDLKQLWKSSLERLLLTSACRVTLSTNTLKLVASIVSVVLHCWLDVVDGFLFFWLVGFICLFHDHYSESASVNLWISHWYTVTHWRSEVSNV